MGALGLDIGASFVRAALVDKKGKVIEKLKEKTEKTSKRRFLFQILNLVSKFKQKRVGIACVGPLDFRKGKIINSPNLFPKEKVNLGKFLSKHEIDWVLMNDCNAAVLAEKIWGYGKKYENLAYVTFSSGIGGGVILNNKLLLGKDGNACEIGHMVIKEGLKCGCGCFGHWEAYCSGKNLPKFFQIFSKRKAYYSAKEIYEKAKQGKEPFLSFVKEVGRINAMGIANLINNFDPELIVLGGAIVLNNRKIFLKTLLLHLKKFSINRIPKIKITRMEEEVVVKGAAALAFGFHSKFI